MKFAIIVATVALGGLLFGYNTGVISGAILFLRTTFHLSTMMLGVVTSIALAGAAIGAGITGPLADYFGRRPVLFGTALVFIAGSVTSAAATNLVLLLCGRLMIGVGIGAASMMTPLYLSEISPARRRGRLVSLNQLGMTTGILISNLVGFGFAASGAWRWMFGLGGLPAVGLVAGMLFLPETPRWLFAHGRIDQARRALRQLRGIHIDIEAEIVQVEADLKQEAKTLSKTEYSHAGTRLPWIVGIGLAIFQQATGINTVIYFAPVIFQASGMSSASAAILATAGIGVVNVGITLLAMWLVDRAGRRPLLLFGLFGMGISLCLLALSFVFGSGPTLATLTAASLAAYVGCFAIGLGPVFWLLIAEIFPSAIRGRAMSAATTANWFANLLVALTFLSFVNLLGKAGVFFLYAALAFAAFLFVWKFLPETKGLSLEAVELLWAARARIKKAKLMPLARK